MQGRLQSAGEGKATDVDEGTGNNVMDLLNLLDRPGALEDIREIMGKLKEKRELSRAIEAGESFVKSNKEGVVDADDPLSVLMQDGDVLQRMLKDPMKYLDVLQSLRKSETFEEIRKVGVAVLEQMRLKNLPVGSPLEIVGLKSAPELNGLVGLLVEPTFDEVESYPERKVVALPGRHDRLAVLPENLCFPKYALGDAVVLDADFAGSEEGLDGSTAIVSELTDEEVELGFGEYKGRLVVDVLPTMQGGPIVHRLLMWPEQLQPRSFLRGDAVELQGLTSDTSLNGAAATVVEAAPGELASSTLEAVVTLDRDLSGQRLTVGHRNLRLLGEAPPLLRGIG